MICMSPARTYTVCTMLDRSLKLTIRISAEEHSMLQALAERAGITASDVLRMYVRRTHAELFGTKTKKKAPR